MAEVAGTSQDTFAYRVDKLRENLFTQDLPVYVFVDPLLGDPFDREAWERQAGAPHAHSITLRWRGLSKDQYPYFFQIPSSSSEWLEISLAIAEKQAENMDEPHSLCGWFLSDETPSKLRIHLGQLMEYRLGDRRWFLRFFDPRVICRLPGIMGRSYRLAGVHDWWFLDRNKELQRQQGEPGAPVVDPTDVQRAGIDRIGMVNLAFSQWCEMGQTPPDSAFEQLDEAIARAHALGLPASAEADCVAFALHRCLVHPRIESHPRVAQWIAKASEGEESYADAAASADEKLWADIESGTWEKGLKETRYG
jgi:hypothetical protein